MSEVKKIATRDSYGNALVELAQNGADDLVVLDADLAAATKTGTFKKAFPERHFNCGIAECNMIGVAAGVLIFTIRPFILGFYNITEVTRSYAMSFMAITSVLVVKSVGMMLRMVMKISAAKAFHASTRWYDALAASDSSPMLRAP